MCILQSLWILFSAAEEEEKRKRESQFGNDSFHAVGYSYGEEYGEEDDFEDGISQPPCEHPATSSVDVGEDVFVLPQGLSVPNDIRLVNDNMCFWYRKEG